MTRTSRPALLIVLLSWIPSAVSLAQQVTENCAVAVLTPGASATLCPANTHPDDTHVLDLSGSTTAASTASTYRSLCGGDRVEFTLGVAVVDGPGPDLQIEEINPNTAEPYRIEVSPDGVTWYPAPGPYTGGTHAGDSVVDLAGILTAPVQFVAIIDASLTTAGTTPGPDFDAIIAINYQAPLFGGSVHAYADTVIAHVPGASTTNLFVDPTRALGMPDAYRVETFVGPGTTTFAGSFFNFVSLPAGANLTVLFSRSWIVDGPGADVVIHEYYGAEPQYTVEASDDGTSFVPLAFVGDVAPAHSPSHVASANVRAFDLAGSGLARADYIRITSTSTATTSGSPGPDIDAVEALHATAKDLWFAPLAPLSQGGTGSVIMTSPAHGGEPYITVAGLNPPVPAGSGLPLPGGGEVRVDVFGDPLIQFELTDPAAALFFGGLSGTLPFATATAVTTMTLPPAPPSLSGIVLTWQSVVLSPSGAIVPSGLLWTRIP